MKEANLTGKLLASVSRSFYLSIKVLPHAVREPIGLAYLLARASDTIADSAQSAASVRLAALTAFREMVRTGEAKSLSAEIGAITRAEARLLEVLPACIERLHSLSERDHAYIVAVLDKITHGQTLDLERFSRAEGVIESLRTAAELEEYTYLVAGCVGEFWTRVCLHHLPNYSTRAAPDMERLGTSFGQGLQLVNILRDLPEDLRAGRCYLPRDEVGDQNPALMREAFTRWSRRAEQHLANAAHYINAVRPCRLRYACILPWRLGVLTLREMQTRPPLDAAERVKVSRGSVRATMLRGILGAASNGVLRKLAKSVTPPAK
jgi:farnesyl-diphosphate farnesyltransferase